VRCARWTIALVIIYYALRCLRLLPLARVDYCWTRLYYVLYLRFYVTLLLLLLFVIVTLLLIALVIAVLLLFCYVVVIELWHCYYCYYVVVI